MRQPIRKALAILRKSTMHITPKSQKMGLIKFPQNQLILILPQSTAKKMTRGEGSRLFCARNSAEKKFQVPKVSNLKQIPNLKKHKLDFGFLGLELTMIKSCLI